MKAETLLKHASAIMIQRGKDYDKPDGERSMARTVAAFNLITGQDLTETQGWQFMQTLKDVRNATGSQPHEDSLLDSIAYAALKAESGINEKIQRAINN